MTLISIEDQYLDLDNNTVIAFTVKSLDIGDLTKRYISVSNRFKVPPTENNDLILGFSRNERSQTSIPYIKNNAKLIQKGKEIKGKCIVVRYDKLYELLFTEDAYSFFSLIDNLKLDQVAPITDSPWTPSDIDDARDNTSGIVSAILDWGRSGAYYQDGFFLPSFYYKTLIESIFSYAGFSVSGNILSNTDYTDLIVPFPGSTFQPVNTISYPTFVSEGAAGSTTGGTLTFTYPADIDENDYLFLFFVSYGNGTFTVDGSWTFVSSTVYPTGTPTFTVNLYKKFADGTEGGTSENVSRSGHSGSNEFLGQVYHFNADQYTIVEASTTNKDNIGTITWNSVTVGATKRTLLAFVANVQGTNPGTPSGYSNVASDNYGGATYLNLNVKENVGSDGSVTATSGSANGWITIHLSLYSVAQNVDWNQYLVDIDCKKLIQDFFVRFAIVYKERSNTIYLKTFDEIIADRANAIDWSARLVKENNPIDFGMDYAQANRFSYENPNDENPGFTDPSITSDQLGEGFFDIVNENIPIQKDIYRSFFNSSELRNTVYGRVARIPVYTADSADNSDFDKSPGIRLLTLKDRTSEPAITFDATSRTDYMLAYFVDSLETKDTGFQYFLDQYYGSFALALQKYKMVTKLYNLSQVEINQYDPHKLIYDGEGYYILNQITNFIPGKLAKVQLFKVG